MNNAADTVRLSKDGGEIVFVFTSTRGKVSVSEIDSDGNSTSVLWTWEAATHELTMRIRLGWHLTPVSPE